MMPAIREHDRLKAIALDQLKAASVLLEQMVYWSALEKIKEALATCEKIAKLLDQE